MCAEPVGVQSCSRVQGFIGRLVVIGRPLNAKRGAKGLGEQILRAIIGQQVTKELRPDQAGSERCRVDFNDGPAR